MVSQSRDLLLHLPKPIHLLVPLILNSLYFPRPQFPQQCEIPFRWKHFSLTKTITTTTYRSRCGRNALSLHRLYVLRRCDNEGILTLKQYPAANGVYERQKLVRGIPNHDSATKYFIRNKYTQQANYKWQWCTTRTAKGEYLQRLHALYGNKQMSHALMLWGLPSKKKVGCK